MGLFRTQDKYVVAFAALALVFVGCAKEKEKTAPTAANAPAVPVVVGKVERRTVPVYTDATARTDAEDTVEIRARVAAFLQAQHFEEGSFVPKGQLLFTLDKREFEAQLSQAQATLAKAEADLAQARDESTIETAKANLAIAQAKLKKADQDVNRLKPLAEQQAVPQQDYDDALVRQIAARSDIEAETARLGSTNVNRTASVKQAEAAVIGARAQIEQARLNLEYCRIATPIAGIVGKREVAPGNLVGRGEATLLTTVSNVNPLRVYLSVSEADYLRYVHNQKSKPTDSRKIPLELTLADGSVFPQIGHLIVADRAVDLKTGTLTLIASFANPGNVLRPGQFGRVKFAAQSIDNALLIPQRSVMELQSAKVVYVVGPENRVQLRTVTLGERFQDAYVVQDGLKAGETIIVEGLQKVRPGAMVVPTEKPATLEKGAAKKG